MIAPPLFAFSALELDVDFVKIALTVVLVVISLGFHEAAHAWVAWKCGDPTGKDLGRITLNPIPHIDPFMTILLPAMLLYSTGGRFAFGGAKPVPVSFHRLRHPWRDMSLVALAGPLSNLALGFLFLLLFTFFVHFGFYNNAAATAYLRSADLLPQVMWNVAYTNVGLAVFNLLPIPPLDGSRVMAWLLPDSLRNSYVSFERFGLFVVFGLMLWSPPFKYFVSEGVSTLVMAIERIVSLGGSW